MLEKNDKVLGLGGHWLGTIFQLSAQNEMSDVIDVIPTPSKSGI